MRWIARHAGQGWPNWISNATRIATAAAGMAAGCGAMAVVNLHAQQQPVGVDEAIERGPTFDKGRFSERRSSPLRGGNANAETAPDAAANSTPAETASEGSKSNIDAAGLKGVTPGASTVEQLKAAWGEPKQTRGGAGIVEFTYEIPGFERVEAYAENDVVSYIVVKFQQPFPPDVVAQQLKFDGLEPVVIYDDGGKPLGQAFPERGVVFSFDPKNPSAAVAQLLLEGINAEQFVARAESRANTRPEAALADLAEALTRDPKHHRGHYTRARILANFGQPTAALDAIEQAIRAQPGSAEYRLYQAQVLMRLGRFEEAGRVIEDTVATIPPPPHLKARAVCLQGDLAIIGPSRDVKQALKLHMQAIDLADGAASDAKAAVRREAKRVLVDAHLGAAHAISLGQWNKKESVVPKWLIKAGEAATDLVKNEGAEPYLKFDVARRALVAIAASQGAVDGSRVTQDFQKLGEHELAAAADPLVRSRVEWELAQGLYTGMQEAHARGQAGVATTLGEAAARHLSNVKPPRDEQDYLLGQINYRMGAEQAVFRNDHATAVKWYAKAIPLLEKPLPMSCIAETSKHGEALISMGVSFWQQGEHRQALELTGEGVHLVEQAVKTGLAETAQLEIPYANLANMHRELGDATNSRKYADLASRIQGATRQ
ncbi:MAG: tetratricopeptide repeat protein [Pirellulales bacterium]